MATFSDINLFFTKHPITADVTKKFDEDAIKASVLNLILTKNYERPFHPEIGCQISTLLFENFTPVAVETMKKTIYDTIEKFEPRVTIVDLRIRNNEDSNDISIELSFKINNSDKIINLTTAIERIR